MTNTNPFAETNSSKNDAEHECTTCTAETNTKIEDKPFGPLIGILIIVVLLVFGGLYFWGASLQKATNSTVQVESQNKSFEILNTTTDTEEYTMTDEEFNALIGDESTDITNTDLDTSLDDFNDFDSLDADLDSLESEL